jgi:predicted O-methyltransferase YrrM
MNIDWRQIKDLDPLGRIGYFQAKYGQIFGWICSGDQQSLARLLPDIARSYPLPMRIVEVGTFLGSTARGLIAMTGGSIISVDNWQDVHVDDPPREWWKTLQGPKMDLSAYVTDLREGVSAGIGADWTESIDLLFVDGDHSHAAASADISQFGRHVVPGGYMLVDDYHLTTVQQAVSEQAPDSDWERLFEPNCKESDSEHFESILFLRRRSEKP